MCCKLIINDHRSKFAQTSKKLLGNQLILLSFILHDSQILKYKVTNSLLDSQILNIKLSILNISIISESSDFSFGLFCLVWLVNFALLALLCVILITPSFYSCFHHSLHLDLNLFPFFFLDSFGEEMFQQKDGLFQPI